MSSYPFLIMTDTIGPYWHDFQFSTSGQAAEYTNTLILSGDIRTMIDASTGRTCDYKVSPEAIKVIKVYITGVPKDPIGILTELMNSIMTEDGKYIMKDW